MTAGSVPDTHYVLHAPYGPTDWQSFVDNATAEQYAALLRHQDVSAATFSTVGASADDLRAELVSLRRLYVEEIAARIAAAQAAHRQTGLTARPALGQEDGSQEPPPILPRQEPAPCS